MAMEMIPTTDRNFNNREMDDINVTDIPENNETLIMKSEKESTNLGKVETQEENLSYNKTKETKDADKNHNPTVKVRPLSTKSTQSTDSREKITRRGGPNHLLKGKLMVKRRNSSSDFVKKGPTLPKRFLKKQETVKQRDAEGGSKHNNEMNSSKLSATDEAVKSKDQGSRPESSRSKVSEKSAGNGHVLIDSKTDKIKSFVQDNKTKTTGIKKTWQRLKSEKVKEKRPISSHGNGSLPTENKINNVANGFGGPGKQDHENGTEEVSIQNNDNVSKETKISKDKKESSPVESSKASQDCAHDNAECTNETTDPNIQYSNVKYTEDEKTKSLVSNSDSWIQSAIPYLPLGLSVICLLMNIILPGSGTVLSGFAILFCGETRIQAKEDQKTVTLCVNVWVGVSQLFTVTFLFVGWFWSLAWGVKLVTLSVDYKRQLKKKRERELQVIALKAFGSSMQVRPMFSVVTE